MASLGDDLLKVVNKLQDLVFNTIGNDSLDLPQIVRTLNLSRNAPSANNLNRSSSALSPRASLPYSRTLWGETFCLVGAA